MTSKLLVLCGIPGSGKTFLSRRLAAEHSAMLYCYDDIPGAHDPARQVELHRQMWENATCDLRSGRTVVLDDLHTTRAMRSDMLAALGGVDCEKTIIVMQTPYDTCVRRNASRQMKLPEFILRSLYERFIPPEPEEGWDEIIQYSSDTTRGDLYWTG